MPQYLLFRYPCLLRPLTRYLTLVRTSCCITYTIKRLNLTSTSGPLGVVDLKLLGTLYMVCQRNLYTTVQCLRIVFLRVTVSPVLEVGWNESNLCIPRRMGSVNLVVIVESVHTILTHGNEKTNPFHLSSILAVGAALGMVFSPELTRCLSMFSNL